MISFHEGDTIDVVLFSFSKKISKTSVTHAINILQACIYKSVKTGLISRCFVKFKMLMQKSIIIMNKKILVATNDFKSSPVLQTCKYRPVKCL